jgi:hypothetical protein
MMTSQSIMDIVANIILGNESVSAGQGAIIGFDGPSGVGKTSVCRQIAKELTSSGRTVVIIPLDWFLVPRIKHSALKKYILGERLSPKDHSHISEKEKLLIDPGKECIYEQELFWRNVEIEEMLGSIRKWIDHNETSSYSLHLHGLWSRETKKLKSNIEINHGNIILVDGKLSMSAAFCQVARYDLTFRLTDDPRKILKRYVKRKYELTHKDRAGKKAEAARAKRFYKLLMSPSWKQYSKRTRGNIDWFVDLESGRISRRPFSYLQ